jgi:hypothetical protein
LPKRDPGTKTAKNFSPDSRLSLALLNRIVAAMKRPVEIRFVATTSPLQPLEATIEI